MTCNRRSDLVETDVASIALIIVRNSGHRQRQGTGSAAWHFERPKLGRLADESSKAARMAAPDPIAAVAHNRYVMMIDRA
jgi:hypothetical protein